MPDSIGLGVVFLAAAVGCRDQPGPAARLARAVPPAKRGRRDGAWYDLAARHGLVSAVLTALPAGAPAAPGQSARAADGDDDAPLAEILLEASPLSTVLHRPTLRALEKDTTTSAEVTAEELLRQPRGRAVLANGLAGWQESARVLGWRSRLLSRLRHKHLEAVLDVYFVARTRFAAQWDERAGWAARELRRGTPDPLAIETLRFWAPLAAIERAERPRPLAALRPLLTGHEHILCHVHGFRLDQGGGTA